MYAHMCMHQQVAPYASQVSRIADICASSPYMHEHTLSLMCACVHRYLCLHTYTSVHTIMYVKMYMHARESLTLCFSCHQGSQVWVSLHMYKSTHIRILIWAYMSKSDTMLLRTSRIESMGISVHIQNYTYIQKYTSMSIDMWIHEQVWHHASQVFKDRRYGYLWGLVWGNFAQGFSVSDIRACMCICMYVCVCVYI